jgi:hypothetical protein
MGPFRIIGLRSTYVTYFHPVPFEGGARAERGTNAFYTEAIKNLETFFDRGGALADSTSMVRTPIEVFLPRSSPQPKALYMPQRIVSLFGRGCGPNTSRQTPATCSGRLAITYSRLKPSSRTKCY